MQYEDNTGSLMMLPTDMVSPLSSLLLPALQLSAAQMKAKYLLLHFCKILIPTLLFSTDAIQTLCPHVVRILS